MKCHKCSRASVIHLTELVTDESGRKRVVEIHLCLAHGVAAGLVAPGTELNPHPGNVEPATPHSKSGQSSPASPTAIVPATQPPTGIAIQRKPLPAEAEPRACPICGTTWTAFKQHGVMGCPNDYAFFEARIVPIVKRAQESATQHTGKVPTNLRQSDPARAVASARLRRELQQAIDAENYEHAANLRDQIKNLGDN